MSSEVEVQANLYNVVTSIVRWKYEVGELLKKAVESAGGGSRKSTPQSSRSTFNISGYERSVQNYLIDVANCSSGEYQDVWNEFANRVAEQCGGISAGKLGEILSHPSQQDVGEIPPLILTPAENGILQLKLGTLMLQLPRNAVNRVVQKQTKESMGQLGLLMLRYLPLNPSGGFFWSIEPKIYRWLDAEFGVLECYASPFNFNAREWCSLFEGDMYYGSRGNFAKVLGELQIPRVLVVNPPYTERQIVKAVGEVRAYLARVSGAEALFLLPSWHDMQVMKELRESAGENYIEMKMGEFSLYNHTTGESFLPSRVKMVVASLSSSQSPKIDAVKLARKMLEVRNEITEREWEYGKSQD